MHQGTTHIIGAGLAGLSAATRLAAEGRHVIVYEATSRAGGRCRSYYDAAFGAVIDNGNHLLLSGNTTALAYLKRINACSFFQEAKEPVFNFIDAKSRQRWKLRLNNGKIPLWLLDRNRRIPGTKIIDYFSIFHLLKAKPQQTVISLLRTNILLYHNLWHPLLLAALNTNPAEASAQLAGAVLRDTLFKGGSACVPLAVAGLSSAFIDPALYYLATRNTDVKFNHRLRNIRFEDGKAARLEFTESNPVPLSASDTVICAMPDWVVTSLLPGIQTPDNYRAILNAHFRVTPPAAFPAILCVVNGTVEWIFTFPDRISITISNADRLIQEEREPLAQRIWQEIAAITSLTETLPPWQIVKEKRATFAATPEQNAKRPMPYTPWPNVYLAGDYVQTGLPATMEGAIRSGVHAAELAMRRA